ncbi:MAG: Holliday junction branch migration protein RuvA [Deltaproteobacteria bacterium]|nr:MAG: Holliday junction branch migration protein RuvA [Deltaproteobacteria bacterium]
MIAYLEGLLREKLPTRVVVDVSGVGYEVWIPLSTFYELPDEGKPISLRIYTHVREDALTLFGFRTARERAAFELLLRTSGVGPKLAQGVLSRMEPDELVSAIGRGDAAALRSIPGVGKRTAERIVIDLRDRVEELLAPEAAGGAPSRRAPDGRDSIQAEAISALANLGYPSGQAERTVAEAAEALGEEPTLESLIRASLRRLIR